MTERNNDYGVCPFTHSRMKTQGNCPAANIFEGPLEQTTTIDCSVCDRRVLLFPPKQSQLDIKNKPRLED